MQLRWRRLEPRDIDHERVWGLVLAVSVVTVLAMPPAMRQAFACPFKALTGLPCLTCGASRGVVSLLSGQVLEAFLWNPLVFLVLAAWAAYSVLGLGLIMLRLPRPRLEGAVGWPLRGTVIMVLAVSWAWLIWRGV